MSDREMLAATADGIGCMTFNNPERRNAVSLEMWDRAEEILKDFAADDPVRGIVLTGNGGRSRPPQHRRTCQSAWRMPAFGRKADMPVRFEKVR